MKRVFISYSSFDKAFTALLIRELERSGVSVWVDEKDISFGEIIVSKLTDAIHTVDHVCFILSKNSLQSKWVQREIEIAETLSIQRGADFIIPIVIDDVDVPNFISMRSYVSFGKSSTPSHSIARLVSKLGGYYTEDATQRSGYFNILNNFAELSHEFGKSMSSKLDILLINGGATIPGCVMPLLPEIISRNGLHRKFVIRAVFLDTDASPLVNGYTFYDGTSIEIADRDFQCKVYEATIWQSNCLQNMGLHSQQLKTSISMLVDIFRKFNNVEIFIKLNPRFPSSRILLLDDIVFYTPFLRSLPYSFYSLKLSASSPIYGKCADHFDFLFDTGRPVEID